MKKRAFNLFLILLMVVTLLPLEASAESTQVMTANEFINYLQYVVDRGDSKYDSGGAQSVGKYDGKNIFFDCNGLGESIIATRGQIVYNRDPNLNPWNLWDWSIGVESGGDSWFEGVCVDKSSDFSNLVPGEWLIKRPNPNYWHFGYYIGNEKVIESTTAGEYKVQVSTIDSSGHDSLQGAYWTWDYHAKAPWIKYDTVPSYLDKCIRTSCSDIVEITSDNAWLKALPCSNETAKKYGYTSVSVIESALPVGTTFQTSGLYKNTEGNYWYAATILNGAYAGKSGYIYRGDTKVVYAPQSTLDNAEGGAGTVHVRGWSFDRDALDSPVPIHVYVGGPAGSGAEGYEIFANTLREDVNNAYPGVGNYHGFDSTIEVQSRGTQTLYVYACDLAGGPGNQLFATATVTISEPKTYTVTYDANGGLCSVTSDVVEPGKSVTLPNATRDGYIFRGWSTSKTGDYGQTGSYWPNGDVTLYAVWRKNSGTWGNLAWKIDNNGLLTISGQATMIDFDERSSDAWLEFRDIITSAKIENGVPNISNNAFGYCSELRKISIPNSVKTIGNFTFMGCGLQNILIPSSVTSIGEAAFMGCGDLTDIMLPEGLMTIAANTFYKCYSLKTISIPNTVRSIGDWAFAGCENWINASIPNNVTSIGKLAFIHCEKITSITIPESVTIMGAGVFSDCIGLIDVDIQGNLESINEGTFDYCEKLERIKVPKSVKSVGDYAFNECNSLVDVYYGGTQQQWNDVTIGESNNALFNASIHYNSDSETASGTWGDVFWILDDSGTLTISGEGNIPNSPGTSSTEAWLAYKSRITSVIIEEGITGIGNGVFYKCDHVSDVTIPEGVETIGAAAFFGCSSLRGVVIPKGVINIGNYAFDGCSALSRITIPDGISSIGKYAFTGCEALTSIAIPTSVTSIGEGALSLCGFTRISVAPGNTAYCDQDGVLFSKDMTVLINYPTGRNGSYVIPEGVVLIDQYAFEECYGLTGITIPEGVIRIGYMAFDNCSGLKNVVLPDSLETLAAAVFQHCTGLKSVKIPAGMTSIGVYCFYDTGLTDVYYGGSPAYWDEVEIWEGNDPLLNATIHYHEKPSGTWGDLNWILDDGNLTISGSGLMEGFDSNSTSAWRAYKDEITSVRIESGVTSVGSYAFTECSELTSVTLPEGLTRFDKIPFAGCVRLMNIVIPTSVTNINDMTFSGCNAVTDIYYCGTQTQWNAVTIGDENGSLLSATVHYNSYGPEVSGTWGQLSWSLDKNGVLNITGTGNMNDFDSPDSTDAWREYKDSILKVVISSGITRIGDGAFLGCGKLIDVTIPESVTSIGAGVLELCTSLKSVEIPQSVNSIGNAAFWSCSNLERLVFPPNITHVEPFICTNCRNLKELTLPKNAESIARYAFKNCINLIDISIPNSVTSIEEGAFNFCSGLSSIELPSYLREIGTGAFAACSDLKTVTIYNRVSTINEGAFWNCESLTDVYYKGALEEWAAIDIVETQNEPLLNATIHYNSDGPAASGTWGDLSWTLDGNGLLTISGVGAMADLDYKAPDAWLAHKDAITSVVIKSGVTSIGGSAFYRCGALESVTIPAGVTSIGSAAFGRCTALTSVTIPKSVTNIGHDAFFYCTALTDIVMPDSVEKIDYCAFQNCSSLTGLVLPSSLTTVSRYLFQNCSGLESITIPAGVTSIERSAFSGCSSLESVTIPASMTIIGRSAFSGCSSLTDAYYGGTQQQWKGITIGISNDSLKNAIIHCSDGIAFNFILPAYLKTIEAEAFSGGAFTSVKLPETATSIGSRAFADCPSLRYIYIPEATGTIASDAFSGVSGLTILGHSGSYAEFYAQRNGYTFSPVA